MRARNTLILLVAGLGLASAACQDVPGDPDEQLPEPAPAPLSGINGTGGPNSFLPEDYRNFVKQTNKALDLPLLDPITHDLGSYITTTIMPFDGGKETFRYAASCALPAGTAVKYDGKEYSGIGFIKNGGDWFSGPVEEATRFGVLTCMAARLNPKGAVIPIFEVGDMVNDDGITNSDDYPFREMVISVADIKGAPDHVIINVWPLEDLTESCGPATEGSLGTRLCDNDPAMCGLVLREDIDTACEETSASHWTCDGIPAIETRLRIMDLPLIHPGCTPPLSDP